LYDASTLLLAFLFTSESFISMESPLIKWLILTCMWFFFAALTGMLYTGEMLAGRLLLRRQKDAWAFSFFYSLIGTVITLPFMLADFSVPHHLTPWVLAALVGVLIVCNNLLLFKASSHLEASLVGTLGKLRFAWVFVFSIVFLGTVFSWSQLAGTLLAILAGAVVIHWFKRPESMAGIVLALSATIFAALIIITTKYLLQSFSVASLTFFATFLPATILNFALMPKARSRTKKLFHDDWRNVVLACSLGTFANLALNKALSLHNANSVVVVSEIFLVLVLVGEHTILREKEQLWIKLISVLLAILGAILIQVHL
jgi:drug/metabolite transporter (DMT)-like permease